MEGLATHHDSGIAFSSEAASVTVFDKDVIVLVESLVDLGVI